MPRFEISNLKCEECKNVFPIPRRSDKKRENGHIKHIWCPFCKKKTAHKENRL